MARRRYQAPKVKRKGNFWVIRVYEDALDDEGRPYRARPSYIIGPCIGPHALTERQANQEASNRVLTTLNNFTSCPNSVMTLSQFVSQHFQPKLVAHLKHAGQEHYKYCLSKILPVLGSFRLRDIKPEDIYRLTGSLEKKGRSPKTVKHVKVAIGSVINFAKELGYYQGDNPASNVRLPELVEKEGFAYSFEMARAVIAELEWPIQEMVLLSMTTTLNVAELCGLRWKRLNLTADTIYSAGEAIPPFSLLVRENYYRNRWGTVKTKARRRTVGIPDDLVEILQLHHNRSTFTKPDDPLFSSRNGTPIDAHNTNSRIFSKVKQKLKVPVSWHVFRHSAATFTEELEMQLSDRVALMGHSRAEMTGRYTHSDVARRRQGQNQLMSRLFPEPKKMKLVKS